MTPLTGVDSAAFVVFLSATLALITWAVLWSARSTSVHLWCGASLASATFVWISLLPAAGVDVPRHLLLPAIATAGVLAGAMRAQALALLRGRSLGVAIPVVLLGAINVMALLTAGHPNGQPVFDLTLATTMLVLLGVAAWSTWRLGREQHIVTAYLLTGTLGVPTLMMLLLAFVSAMSGEEVLQVSRSPVPHFVVATNAFIASCNAALFIGVVLERLSQTTAAAAAALADERNARLRLADRARMMHDLHDGFGSQLTAARIRAEHGALSQQEVVTLLGECIGDLHLVVDTLEDAEGRLGDALRFLRLRMHNRLFGGPVQLHWSLDVDDLPPMDSRVIVQILRIAQEALNNALRHAHAQHIRVTAASAPTHIRILVSDDGVGIDARHREGNGLRSMRSRADALGASLVFGTVPPGTTVELVVPR